MVDVARKSESILRSTLLQRGAQESIFGKKRVANTDQMEVTGT